MATVRSNSFSLTIDSDPLLGVAADVEALASRTLLRLSAVDAVNDVVTRFDATAKRGMNAGLNLSDDYIASRMKVTPARATGSTIRGEIRTRGDLTIIGNYPHKQLRVAGTPVRSGVSRGRRPSGVLVGIRTDAFEFEPQWFTMRLRNSGKTGLFVRTTASGGKPVHKYGPSPYSLFRYQIETRQDDLADDLSTSVATRVSAAVERAFA